MPVITGDRGGGSTGPYLTLQWDVIQTDIANNRSKVRLILKLNASHRINFSASKSGVLQGSGFTYTSGANGTGSWTLRTTEVWVSHNSDGTKTQNFSGSFNINISFSGSWVGTLSVSGNATLPAIPRQSLLNSASMTNLKNGSSSTLSIGRTVYHNGFYHIVSIYDGSTFIWNTPYFSGAPETSYTIPSATVNYMLNRMSTSTSKTFTVLLRTYTSGGGVGLIGTQSMNMSVGVDSTVKPTVSGLSISQEGNSVSSHYLQTISRVKAEFSATAGYGATVSTRTIIVRKTDGSNAQTISGASGTTTNPIASTGNYEVVATATDSRGRTSEVLRTTFTATAYNQPRISKFTVTRQADAQTVVDISRAGSWTSLGGSNVLNISVERRQGTGTWSSVDTATGTATNGSFTRDFTESGNNVSLSYDYRLVISDKFGNYAESIASISTQRVVLDIHKNEGVGIGKVREKGVLDVDGEAHFKGDVFVNGASISSTTRLTDVTTNITDTISFWTNLPQGSYFVSQGQLPNQPAHWGIIQHNSREGEFNTIWYSQPEGTIYRKSGNANNNTAWRLIDRPQSGSNTNGNWVRFGDGTQICWAEITINYSAPEYMAGTWTYPVEFSENSILSGNRTIGYPNYRVMRGNFTATGGTASGNIRLYSDQNFNFVTGDTGFYQVIAIGRWK